MRIPVMKKIFDDLYQTEKNQPFPGMQAFAYYLLSSEGNSLIYNGGSERDLNEIQELGGLNYQFLSHRDEISPHLKTIKNRFYSRLCCHKNTQVLVEKVTAVDQVNSRREIHSTKIEIIPTPGHTDGCISFFYKSPTGYSYLFTGDLISMSGKGWDTFIIPGRGGGPEGVLDSMRIYRQLSPDVVIPSGSSDGSPTFFKFSQEEWVKSIDNYIERLQNDLGV